MKQESELFKRKSTSESDSFKKGQPKVKHFRWPLSQHNPADDEDRQHQLLTGGPRLC